jgi:hypothetical protein
LDSGNVGGWLTEDSEEGWLLAHGRWFPRRRFLLRRDMAPADALRPIRLWANALLSAGPAKSSKFPSGSFGPWLPLERLMEGNACRLKLQEDPFDVINDIYT